MTAKGERSEQEMQITLRRLALEFGVDIVPAQGLDGLKLEAWLSQAENKLYLWYSRELMASVLIKPRDRLHWTLDRAFSDADVITAAAMASSQSAVTT